MDPTSLEASLRLLLSCKREGSSLNPTYKGRGLVVVSTSPANAMQQQSDPQTLSATLTTPHAHQKSHLFSLVHPAVAAAVRKSVSATWGDHFLSLTRFCCSKSSRFGTGLNLALGLAPQRRDMPRWVAVEEGAELALWVERFRGIRFRGGLVVRWLRVCVGIRGLGCFPSLRVCWLIEFSEGSEWSEVSCLGMLEWLGEWVSEGWVEGGFFFVWKLDRMWVSVAWIDRLQEMLWSGIGKRLGGEYRKLRKGVRVESSSLNGKLGRGLVETPTGWKLGDQIVWKKGSGRCEGTSSSAAIRVPAWMRGFVNPVQKLVIDTLIFCLRGVCLVAQALCHYAFDRGEVGAFRVERARF